MASNDYDPIRTALLIVDPYNDFMSEGGKLFNAIKETAESVNLFPNLRKIVPAARAAGFKVVIVPHHRSDPHGHDYDHWEHVNMFQDANRGVKAFEAGTWGGEFNEEFGPQEGDLVVKEHWAQNGFANTDLDMQLKQRRIEKLIFVGLIANSCIESTARYAMELGYHVTLVKDGTAAFSEEGMKAAAVNGPMFAHAILSTEELLARIPPAE